MSPRIARESIAHVHTPDAASLARGAADARARAPWRCPDDLELMSYSLGYADELAERACCAGARAQPEDGDV